MDSNWQSKDLQPALSVDEQVQNLVDKGLLIEDIDGAKKYLSHVSYFRLIKAYSLEFKPKNGNYSPGTTFRNLVDIYNFDIKLRQILFPIIEYIEIDLRCKIANYFSKKYGVLGYQDPSNFDKANYHWDFMLKINKEIERNKTKPFVANFTTQYKNGALPFYALIELFSFGTLSKFYRNLLTEDQKEIAAEYKIKYEYLDSWIASISYVRNICAHYGRLYNINISKAPRLYSEYKVTAKNKESVQRKEPVNNRSVFAVILCIKHLTFNTDYWATFLNAFVTLIESYKSVINLTNIGLTSNWRDLLRK